MLNKVFGWLYNNKYTYCRLVWMDSAMNANKLDKYVIQGNSLAFELFRLTLNSYVSFKFIKCMNYTVVIRQHIVIDQLII